MNLAWQPIISLYLKFKTRTIDGGGGKKKVIRATYREFILTSRNHYGGGNRDKLSMITNDSCFCGSAEYR